MSVAPFLSLSVATSVNAWPALIDAGGTESVMLATAGCVTATAATPDFPSIVALTAEVPCEIALMTPDASTVTEDWFELNHVTVLPLSTFPLWSLASAVSVSDAPVSSVGALGDTVTVVTTGVMLVLVPVPVDSVPPPHDASRRTEARESSEERRMEAMEWKERSRGSKV